MARKLLPTKIVIEFDKGNFINGFILYKVDDEGVITRTRTVGLRNASFSRPVLNGIIQKFIEHAQTAEGING